MRIIGEIDHPVLKISVFRNDNRISVKFETAQYEQTFKLGDDERFASVEAVRQWADDAMIEQVLAGFRLMHANHMAAQKRLFPPDEREQFEEII